MYLLKQQPEDFVVKEISSVPLQLQGKYLYFTIRKRNRNTLDVVTELARVLGIKEKQIGFAGSKDKQAVTIQFCSVVGVVKERLLAVKLTEVEIQFAGYGEVPISLGDLAGNHFEIVVRNLDSVSVELVRYIPNYFDEQRFSKNNVAIGRSIIHKDFKAAATLISHSSLQHHLQHHPQDFIGSLKRQPLRLLRMYVNAYQSYLWNETLTEYLRKAGTVLTEITYSQGKLVFVNEAEKFLDFEIPLIGFASKELEQGSVAEIITSIMKREKVDYSDFIIKQIPALTLEGEMRKIVVKVDDLKINSAEPDELNQGKQKIKFCFSLPKGSYATMVVKNMFIPNETG